MKKIALLISALGSVASANAQSSLTFAGTVDAAATSVKGSVASRNLLASGSNSTSKLIFRGREDLGSGMYAGFWLEAGFLADDGTGQATNANNQAAPAAAPAGTQGLTFNRRSIVTLGGNWGEAQLGRNLNTTFDAYSGIVDVFGAGVGIGINFISSINTNAVRVSNSIGYATPKVFGGFSGNVLHYRGENASNVANADDGTGNAVKLGYASGPFAAWGAYARTKFGTGDGIYRNVAGYYDNGSWKLSLSLNNDELGTLRQRGYNIGGIYRIGVGEIKASYSALRTNAAGEPEGKKLAVGYVHNLSKRTAVYTTYARVRNNNGATFAISGSTTGANQSSTGFELGLRHNF